MVTQIWYLKNASAGTHVVTRTGGFGSFEGYSIEEYSGIDASAPFDVAAGAKNNAVVDDTPSSGVTATTAQADELLFGCIGGNGIADYSDNWLNSFTNRGAMVGGGARIHTRADRIVSATGTYDAAASADGTGGTWHALIATFKGASAGGGGGNPWYAYAQQ